MQLNIYLTYSLKMKKGLKILKKTALLIASAIILFFAIMAAYHSIMLPKEAKEIEGNGTLVEIDGHNMNIFVDGAAKKEGATTLVLLSGSGVAAPVYDYKLLYSKLSDKYRVAIVEKFGYGYSDVSGLPRDVKTMVNEDREALKKAGENGPYILMPHSMSALEAIYWTSTYPDEIKAIIGLDMAVPDSYNEDSDNLSKLFFNKTMTSYFGMHRIPALCYLNKEGLSDQEIKQLRYLTYTNTLNDDVYSECKIVYENAKTVKELGYPNVPILMFTSNLGDPVVGKYWMAAQDNFAKQSPGYVQIKLDCGHNLHYYKSEYIAHQIKEFITGLE